MYHSGIYPKARKVVGVDTKYYLIALEEWARRMVEYLSGWELNRSERRVSQLPAVVSPPLSIIPAFTFGPVV